MSGQDWFGYTSMGTGDGKNLGVRRHGKPAAYGAPRNIRAPRARESPARASRAPVVPTPATVLGNAYMESHGKMSPRRSPRTRRNPRARRSPRAQRNHRRGSPSRHHRADVTEFLAKAGEKASMEEIAWEVQQLNNFLNRAGMSQTSPPPRPGLRGRVHIPPKEPPSPPSPPSPQNHSQLREGFSAWAEEVRNGTERQRHIIEAGVELLESRARRRIQQAAFKMWQVRAAVRRDWRYEERQLQRKRTLAAQRRRHKLMSSYQRWVGYTAGVHAGASPLAHTQRRRLGPGRRQRAVARKYFGSRVDSSSDDSRDDLEEYWRNQRLLRRLTPDEQRLLRTHFASSSSDDEQEEEADHVRWARRRASVRDASTVQLNARRSNRTSQLLMGRALPGAEGRSTMASPPARNFITKAANSNGSARLRSPRSRSRSISPRLRSSRSFSPSQSPRLQTPAATPLRRFRAKAVLSEGEASVIDSDRAWRIMYGDTRNLVEKKNRKTAKARGRLRRNDSPPSSVASNMKLASWQTLDDSSSDESLTETMAMSPRTHRISQTGWHAMSLNDEQSTRAMKILFSPGGSRVAAGDEDLEALERQRRGLRQKRKALRQAKERNPLGLVTP